MNYRHIFLGVLINCALFLGTLASQEATDDTGKDEGLPQGQRMQMWKKLLEKFDKDGDGRLNEQERQAMKQKLQERREALKQDFQEMKKQCDLNGDGTLDEAEREMLREKMLQKHPDLKNFLQKRRGMLRDRFCLDNDRRENRAGKGFGPDLPNGDKQELRQRFDKDGDGTLSEEEKKAAREAFRQKRPQAKAFWDKLRQQFDKDGDGKFSEEEKKAIKVAWQAKKSAMKQAIQTLKKQLDKDGDGRLNQEERKALKEALMQKYPELKELWERRRANRSQGNRPKRFD